MQRAMFLFTIALFLFMPWHIMAQDQSTLRLELDLANFRLDEEKNYVELYYAFSRPALAFQKTASGMHASVLMKSIVHHAASPDKPTYRTWRVPLFYTDTTMSSNNSLVGKISYTLLPGRYLITLIAQDEGNLSRVDTARFLLEVNTFSRHIPSFSDLELCSSIKQIERDTNNIFYKNTLEVIPNPSLVFGMSSPVLMYYVELYNCRMSSYIIKSEIINSLGKTIFEKKKRKLSQKSSTASTDQAGTMEYGAIPIHTHPSNFYTFVITLQDTSGKSLVSQSKKFYVYNPSIKDTMLAAADVMEIAEEFVSLSESELDKEFLQARYIAIKEETEKWKVLSGSEGKKKFLTQFWQARDSDPTTTMNEFRFEYMNRVSYADENFRTSYREGWQTDRGRVYILYGKPDAIERFSSESDTKPYQIWIYDHIEGGVKFYFVDRFGFNNYELVHSTKRYEIYDESWERFIRAN